MSAKNANQTDDRDPAHHAPAISLKVVGLGHTVVFDDVPPTTTTVGDLKSMIGSRTGLPAPYLRLLARGRKLDDETATLSNAGVGEHRTRIMLMHSASYAADRAGAEAISALNVQMDDLEGGDDGSRGADVVHEMVTRICCELDGVDVGESETLRAMRRRAILRAEEIDRAFSGSGGKGGGVDQSEERNDCAGED